MSADEPIECRECGAELWGHAESGGVCIDCQRAARDAEQYDYVDVDQDGAGEP